VNTPAQGGLASESEQAQMLAPRSGGYVPLRSYALLGDMRGAALVATDGAIDWLALPVMDAPPLCAAVLDPVAGGAIELTPAVPFEVERRYLPSTMVLETRFITESGTVRVTDALNRGRAGVLPWAELGRRVEVTDGEVPMRWSVRPGHGLASLRPWCYVDAGTVRIRVGDRLLAVITQGLGEPLLDSHGVSGRFVASAECAGLMGVVVSERGPLYVPSAPEIAARIDATAAMWRRWSDHIGYAGRWTEAVVRSALTLKALTVTPSGAIAAAATTSLPEKVGGERNFDYRFAWIRDATFAIDAMNRLGLSEEVHASLSWLLKAVSARAPDLRVFYALDGSAVSAEMRAADAPGYRGSRPANVGNTAANQLQLGCFGDLLDAVQRYVTAGGELDDDTAALVATLADRVCELWQSPDAGLWELGDPKPYTISKIGCWVALDRALRLADAGQLTSLHANRWRAERAEIRCWIEANCWSESKRAYTFYAGSEELDAAVLLAARTGYCEGSDPRLHTTIDAIAGELGAGTGLLYRYSGQARREGAFLACSCWMVEALSHARRPDEATRWLEALVGHANDVGLYTEEIDPGNGDLLGNLPQTLSHLALIGAATAILAAVE
jgi:GH15 family glucan-1,4-alpha-glucosidase